MSGITRQAWLRDPDRGISRPVPVKWTVIPRVGDEVSISTCESFIHDTYWVVDKVVWSDREEEPRVDLRPKFPTVPTEGSRP